MANYCYHELPTRPRDTANSHRLHLPLTTLPVAAPGRRAPGPPGPTHSMEPCGFVVFVIVEPRVTFTIT
eukprot:scaffold150011_cov30-Tisochrysis_lutea.AAC.2